MKHIYLAIFLLSSIPSLWSVEGGRLFKADIIEETDGRFPMKPVMDFMGRIVSVLNQNYSTNDTIVTLHDLVSREHGLDSTRVQPFLKKCIMSFFEMAQRESYLKIFHMIHPIFDELVEAWANQYNMKLGKFYQFAAAWKKQGTEYDILSEQIMSLAEYEQFLQELRQFLADLTVSFPKSYAAYQASR